MSPERSLNFFTIPRSILVAEAMGEYSEMIAANVPHMEMEGLTAEDMALLAQLMLDNDERRRLNAEEYISSAYRLPDDIVEADVVDLEERRRITTVIEQVDALSLETLSNRDPHSDSSRAIRDIFLIRNQPFPEASWVRIPIEGRVMGVIGPGAYRIHGFTAYLDAVDHFDDYIPGKGSDEFFLNRDEHGEIKSYRVKYKGDFYPITPWDYMHRADLPVIQQFIGRVQEDMKNVTTGETRVQLH